jgi:dihydrofolate synthase/folylpolyglutamate synthase
LNDVRERIQINRRMIGKGDFARLVEHIYCHPRAVPAGRRGGGDLAPLTYFEFLTLVSFLYFAEQKVNIAVLEVGLGGRFDATNVVTPLASVITRIGLDHQGYLGDTLEKIAFEKAGVIKEGVPVVTVDQEGEAMRVIRDVAEEKGALLHVVSPHEVKYRLGLLGGHQNENAALAIRAAEIVKELVVCRSLLVTANRRQLTTGDRRLAAALAVTRWPGRLEVVSREPLVILDGAHNPNGAEALARFLKDISRSPFYRGGRVFVIFGAMADKDIAGMLRPLIPVVDEWVITRPNMERAARVEDIRKFIGTQATEQPDVRTAIKRTLASMSAADALIITGSLYMLAETTGVRFNYLTISKGAANKLNS